MTRPYALQTVRSGKDQGFVTGDYAEIVHGKRRTQVDEWKFVSRTWVETGRGHKCKNLIAMTGKYGSMPGFPSKQARAQ